MKDYDVIIVGGGASGFFTAINIAETNSKLKILILEKGKEVLQKVKISGGGRCNVTHAEFIPNELAKNYPRGEKELRGPFHNFMTGDVMGWFENRGVELKIEDDGRVFPTSNSSQTIIDCLLTLALKLNIQIERSQIVTDFLLEENEKVSWQLKTKTTRFSAQKIVIATGSQTKIWEKLSKLGHSVTPPVPSLFTFNCNDLRIKPIPGVSVIAQVIVKSAKLKNEGPILITHWGFSGPAILKLSAWGARSLNELDYKFDLQINWTNTENFESCKALLNNKRLVYPKQQVIKNPLFKLPKRLWVQLVTAASIIENQRWADLSKKQLVALASELTLGTFFIDGKSIFKDEFVTAGGVNLKEINFKTYQSQKLPNCYLVGEVLNIDAITGGFNFQNAWTSGFLAAKSIAG